MVIKTNIPPKKDAPKPDENASGANAGASAGVTGGAASSGGAAVDPELASLEAQIPGYADMDPELQEALKMSLQENQPNTVGTGGGASAPSGGAAASSSAGPSGGAAGSSAGEPDSKKQKTEGRVVWRMV